MSFANKDSSIHTYSFLIIWMPLLIFLTVLASACSLLLSLMMIKSSKCRIHILLVILEKAFSLLPCWVINIYLSYFYAEWTWSVLYPETDVLIS